MTNSIKISQLPEATTPLTGLEQVLLVQNSATKKSELNDILAIAIDVTSSEADAAEAAKVAAEAAKVTAETARDEAEAAAATIGATATEGFPLPGITEDATTDNTTFDRGWTAPAGGAVITEITIKSLGGATIYLIRGVVDGSGNLDELNEQRLFSMSAGTNTINTEANGDSLHWEFNEGESFGWSGGQVRFKTSSNPTSRAVWGSGTTPPTVGMALSNSTAHEYKVSYKVATGLYAAQLRADRAARLVGIEAQFGFPYPFPGTDDLTVGVEYALTVGEPATEADLVSGVPIKVASAGVVRLIVASIDGSNVLNSITADVTVPVVSGTQVIPCALRRAVGQYLIIQTSPLRFKGSGAAGRTYKRYVGVVADGVTFTTESVHGFCAAIETKTGLAADVHELSVGDPSGSRLFDGADLTGATDQTARLTAARGAHPTPLLPAGTLTVTEIPFYGEGLHGPCKLVNSGVRVVLPPAPMRGSPYLGLRSFFMSQIFNGAGVGIVGDSISNGYQATTSQSSWVGLLARFANMGIALDEATVTNFDTTDPSGGPSFHGITLTGTTSLSATDGPSKTARQLNAGASMSFVGVYERIGFTYKRVASGGTTVELAFNAGAAFGSTSTTGTATDDVYYSAATSQTGSGTYTLTNTGSNPVIITSLTRLGTKVALSPPRLRVFRFARGGHLAGDYAAAQFASMKRIMDNSSGGGTSHFLIPALGTNDTLAGTSYATLKTNFETLVDDAVAAGFSASRMRAVLPWRWSSYPSGNYEEGLAAFRDAYKTKGVPTFRTSSFDLVAMDGGDGHPFDTGMYTICRNIVLDLAESA